MGARTAALRAIMALVVATATLVVGAEPAAAATLTIGGYIFHDLDADGLREPGEPGLAGLAVHHSGGTPVTTTDAAGHYRLTDLPTSGGLILEAGWLRAQCYLPEDLDCASGPGADNDFPTRNQLFVYPLAGAVSTEDFNAALLPDWPGPGMTPPAPVAGVTPANEVDVAARLSGGPDTCGADAFGICEAGDTVERFGQLHNQGTRPITGLRAKLQVPPGDCLNGVAVVSAALGVGEMTTVPAAADFTCDTRVVELSFPGTLVPAGVIRLSVKSTVTAGPGTPGCTLTAPPAATCSAAAPQGRTLMLGVSHIAQRGDPDSTFCARGDLRGCPTGVHDKRREPDEVDPAGHNVDAAFGGTDAFNLRMDYARAGRLDPLTHPGEEITVRGWVRNQIGADEPTNQAHAGATVRFFFPAGTEVTGLPAPHALRTCAEDPPPPPPGRDAVTLGGQPATPPGPVVTCVYRGPLAPHVASIALDIVVRVPADWPVGRPYRTVACTAPVAGQAGEQIPTASQPCDLRTVPLFTPTDNDDSLLLLVVPQH